MFHEGDLQSGITLAIQQSKVVACFIRDESPESSAWENKWFYDETLEGALSRKAVLLRIEAASQEAGFLSAFCPVKKVPALVVIHNGQLQEHLQSGIVQDEFTSRLLAVLGESQAVLTPQSPSTGEEEISSNLDATPTSAQRSQPAATPANPSPIASSTTHASPSTVQDLLNERRIRLEAEHQRQVEAEKASRAAKAKARREAAEAEASSSSPGAKKEPSYAAQQRLRLQQARQEKERILAQIEADKVERRLREQQRKEAASVVAPQEHPELSARSQTPKTSGRSSGNASRECQLQVRLFDGSTLRASFPRTATLRADIRPWVDQAVDAPSSNASTPPYSFKHILTPLPNRTIFISDEESSLDELDLFPSATLVLVPVQGYTEAYRAAGGRGYLGMAFNGINGAFDLVSSGVGAITGALGSFLGGSGQQSSTAPVQESTSHATGAQDAQAAGQGSTIKVRTLADQRVEERGDGDRQFYNGNQTNFEPRKDDEET